MTSKTRTSSRLNDILKLRLITDAAYDRLDSQLWICQVQHPLNAAQRCEDT